MSEINYIQSSYQQAITIPAQPQQEIKEPPPPPPPENSSNDTGSTGVISPVPEMYGKFDYFA